MSKGRSRERERDRETESDRESEAAFRLQAVTTEPSMGLEPMNHEIMT